MEFEKINESVNETFTAANEKFNYRFEISKIDNAVKSITSSITENKEDHVISVGHASYVNDTKALSFPGSQTRDDIIAHVNVIEDFVAQLNVE